VLRDLAWLLSTWPDPSVRNASDALALAQRANRLAAERDPLTLRALAAAFAENSQFTDAAATTRRALQLIDPAANAPLASDLTAQLKLYEAGRPFREPAEPASPPPYLRR
jgi:hypothetical protein